MNIRQQTKRKGNWFIIWQKILVAGGWFLERGMSRRAAVRLSRNRVAGGWMLAV